jgi:hypothetical protein
MADQIQLRGGTTAESQVFTGASREVSVDTDKKVLVVHDGVQAGGYPQVSEESLSELRPGENLLINSGFNICRRKAINGNSELFDFAGAANFINYGPDMWAVNDNRTAERIFNDAPSYSTSGVSLRGAISSGTSATNAGLKTAVELSGYNSSLASDNQFPVGTTYTISFGAKVSAGVSWRVYSAFSDSSRGTDNAVTILDGAYDFTGTGAWEAERRSITFTIPQAPASTNQCLSFIFETQSGSAGNSDFIQLADVKLERGSVATPYVAPDRIEEVAKTARYCLSNSTGGSSQQTGSVVSSTSAVFMLGAVAEMRTTPTFVTEGNNPALQIFSPGVSGETVTPSQLGFYGGDIRLVVEKDGGGNLSTGSGSVYLRVFNSYILDASL